MTPGPQAQLAPGTDWRRIGLILACGVFAATQIGKLPPAIPALRESLGASMLQLGWIASIFNLTAATAGLLTGVLADRLGRRRALNLGLLTLGAGSLLGAFSVSVWGLLASRIVEGFGFVAVVVSAPALLREAATESRVRLVLGAWSSYTALGMTAMLLLAPLWQPSLGWRGSWWFGVAGSVVLYAIVRRLPSAGPQAQASSASAALDGLREPVPWLLGVCFTIYTAQWMGMMIWLPTFLHDDLGLELVLASAAVAGIVLANAPGNWLGGWLSARRFSPPLLVLVPALAMGIGAAVVFAATPDRATRLVICVGFSFVGGILPASIYACVPAVAARRGNFGAVNGLMVQSSNIGALLGPPFAAAMVGFGGWPAVGFAYLATSVLSCIAMIVAARSPTLRVSS